MRTIAAALIGASLLLTAGCSGMSKTEQRTLSGGAIGAGAGAAIGALTGGSALGGALLGGAAGAAGGYLYDREQKKR